MAPSNAYAVNLMTGETTPPRLMAPLEFLGRAWADYFDWSLARHGIPRSRVEQAVLTMRFAHTRAEPSWIGGFDRPFVCNVRIRDDRGREYEHTETGHCSRLSEFDPDLPEGQRPRRAVEAFDVGRIAMRIRRHARPEPDPRL
jgi:hypothetical protein